MSTVAFICFIVFNSLVLFNSFLLFHLVRQNKKPRTILDVIIFIATLFLSQIVIFEISLGIFGRLNSIALYFLIFATTVFLLFIKKPDLSWPRPIKISHLWPLWLIIFLPIIIILIFRLVVAMLQVPLEYDALVYHLPIVVEWLKTGNLMNVYYTVFAGPLGFYPSNFDLLYLWVMMPFKNDLLVNLLNFPLYILLVLATYQTARNLGLSKKVALFVAATPLYIPVFFQQAGTILVDLFFTTMFMVSIYFLQESRKAKDNYADALLFGLSLGLFAGTKYLGIVYMAPLLLLFILVMTKKGQYRSLSLGCLGIFLTGTFFYIRNWLNAGNPLFPLEIKLSDWTIFPGYMSTSQPLVQTALWSHIFKISVIKSFFYAFFIMTGFIGLFIIGALVITLIYLFKEVVIDRKKLKDIWPTALVWSAALLYAYLYLHSPYSYRDLIHNIRYAMVFVMIGIGSLGLLIERMKKLQPLFLTALTTAYLYTVLMLFWSAADPHFDIALAWQFKFQTLLVISTIGIFILTVYFFWQRKKRFLVCLIITIFLSWHMAVWSATIREQLAPFFYKAWYGSTGLFSDIISTAHWFNLNHPRASLAYTGFHFHYPLFGRDLGRSVDYININNCVDCRYADYKTSPQSVRRDPNYSNWIANLTLKNKNFIVINKKFGEPDGNYEWQWIQAHPEKFRLVYEIGDVYSYKIVE